MFIAIDLQKKGFKMSNENILLIFGAVLCVVLTILAIKVRLNKNEPKHS